MKTTRTTTVGLCALLAGLTCLTQARADCEPGWLGPEAIEALSSTASALAVFDDGSGPALYAGGAFMQAGGSPASRIAKWDGTAWSEVGGGANGSVLAMAVFDDGTGPALYIGGQFTIVGGDVPANRVARWDGNTWSPLGEGFNGSINGDVNILLTHDDGNGPALYAGGVFEFSGSEPMNRIAKWDGANWASLGEGIGGAGLLFVCSLATWDNGEDTVLAVGGSFTSAGGNSARNIAIWDGASWSPLGSGMSGFFPYVAGLGTFNDGNGSKLYAAGSFTSAGGTPVQSIASWNGTNWTALGDGLDGCGKVLTAYTGIAGAELYVGGSFTTAGGIPANRLASWDGYDWAPVGEGVDGGASVYVQALLVQDNTTTPTLTVGGFFANANGTPAGHIALWRCDPPPIGACCHPNGTCVEMSHADCLDADGDYMGDDAPCTPDLCPQPLGACCDPDGTCAIETETDCTGEWQGMDTSCEPNLCPQPLGACCYLDGTCTLETEADCIGDWQGMDTNCEPNLCPQPTGACCLGAQCDVTTEIDCATQNGDFLGIDVECYPNPCVLPADCHGDYNCDGQRNFDDVDFMVAAIGGEQAWIDIHVARYGEPPFCEWLAINDPDSQGDETTFEDIDAFVALIGVPCPELPTGACCIAGECALETEQLCLDLGGLYQGDQTACDPNPCLPIPCPGDYNCDGQRDFDDVDFMVAAIAGEQAWIDMHIARYGEPPTCDWLAINDPDGQGDGTTFDDIDAFVALIGVPCGTLPLGD